MTLERKKYIRTIIVFAVCLFISLCFCFISLYEPPINWIGFGISLGFVVLFYLLLINTLMEVD
jgi:hypothetical protein